MTKKVSVRDIDRGKISKFWNFVEYQNDDGLGYYSGHITTPWGIFECYSQHDFDYASISFVLNGRLRTRTFNYFYTSRGLSKKVRDWINELIDDGVLPRNPYEENK